MSKINIIKGDIIYNISYNKQITIKDGFLIFSGNKIIGTFKNIPEEFKNINITDYTNKLIMPGLIDLHTHAPQYPFRGIGMDMELLPWLNKYAFKEEAKYKNIEYANNIYNTYVDDIKKSATTRFCIFGTLHRESTELLMSKLEKIGINSFVGKVNMDINCPDNLSENSEESIKETEKWLNNIYEKYKYTKPIITPRFVPSCSSKLMKKLGEISEKYNLPVQSHLSENLSEISLVKEMYPKLMSYADVYNKHNIFGEKTNCIMAHCVHSDKNENELSLLKNRNVWIAHCPDSNTNLSSGIAPTAKYLREGYKIGLGSDIAGGTKLSIFNAIADAIKVSKLRWIYIDNKNNPLTISEAFYMATKGGGKFFGNVGSFEKNYESDIIIIDDKNNYNNELTIKERLEKVIYLSEDYKLVAKYVQGRLIYSI